MPSHHHLKTPAGAGRRNSEQMDVIADLMDEFSVGEVRVTMSRTWSCPCAQKGPAGDLRQLKELDFAAPNAGLITDIIACPGLDYCDLAMRAPSRSHKASPRSLKIWTASMRSAN